MTATAIENELMKLEREFWDAMKKEDAQTAMRLSDEKCVIVGAQGASEIDRQTLRGMIEGAPYKLHDYEIDNSKAIVRSLTNDMAVVAYPVKEKLTVEGKPVELEAYDSSVWYRRDGKWVCVLHTESIAGDPFGRK